MAEAQIYSFSFQEVAEALVKQQDLHEGLWGVYIEFGIGAANINKSPTDPNDFVPAAIVPVVKIGVQRFEAPSNLTVDAAIVNPVAKATKKTGK